MAKQAYAGGNYTRAVHLCDQLLAQLGKRDDLLNIKALSLLALGQLEAAESTIIQAIKLNSRVPGMHLNAARIYLGLSLNRQAKRHVQDAVRLAPRETAILYQAALLSRECGDYSQALRIIDRCIQVQPGLAPAWHLKGAALLDLGKMEPAQQALEKAVTLQPGNARALSALVKLRGDRLEDTATVALLEKIRSSDMTASDRGSATFSLAQLYRRDGRYESAFELYQQANRITASTRPFNREGWQERIAGLLRSTGKSSNFVPAAGTAGSNLVFIVGMPRSGTSLCEQVLSAHPQVLACGELSTMQNIESSFARQGLNPYQVQQQDASRPKEFEAAGARYLAALPRDHQKYKRVTDKAPMNFERVGLIHQVFPAARFIYCRRHPLDTILSCFIQDFHAGLEFAFDLDHITQVYIDHVRLMEYWTGLLPGYIHTVDYESLVTDLESEAQAMADFLQLEFEPGMLQPHRQERSVTTASNVQVRKPVYTSSIGNWKNYREQLDTTIRKLQNHGILDADLNPSM